MMNIECTLEFRYTTKNMAKNIAKSIRVDDLEFVKTIVSDNKIISKVKAKSISSLLHTLEDYLVCIGMAEKVLEKKNKYLEW